MRPILLKFSLGAFSIGLDNYARPCVTGICRAVAVVRIRTTIFVRLMDLVGVHGSMDGEVVVDVVQLATNTI